jgi:hypothetical protein
LICFESSRLPTNFSILDYSNLAVSTPSEQPPAPFEFISNLFVVYFTTL